MNRWVDQKYGPGGGGSLEGSFTCHGNKYEQMSFQNYGHTRGVVFGKWFIYKEI